MDHLQRKKFMARFAKLNSDNVVTDVVVINNDVILDDNGNEIEQKGVDFLRNLYNEPNAKWLQTSFTGKIRGRLACVYFNYDPIKNEFFPPKPLEYPSWVWNNEWNGWRPPTPAPTDGPSYDWNEETLSWVISTIQTKAEYLNLGTNTKAFDPNSKELYFPN